MAILTIQNKMKIFTNLPTNTFFPNHRENDEDVGVGDIDTRVSVSNSFREFVAKKCVPNIFAFSSRSDKSRWAATNSTTIGHGASVPRHCRRRR